jgi:hypothetical protein
MTHVVDITELYKLIPECKSLEGIKFKDIRHLLQSVIAQIEASSSWEFVQYIPGQPSLFVVREKEKVVAPIVAEETMPWESKSKKESKNTSSKTTKKTVENKNLEEEKVVEQEVLQNIFVQTQSPKLFEDIKLPWSK